MAIRDLFLKRSYWKKKEIPKEGIKSAQKKRTKAEWNSKTWEIDTNSLRGISKRANDENRA